MRTVTRVSTNWPGHSAWSALSNTALARTVPISGSTVLSTKLSVPVQRRLAPGHHGLDRRVLARRLQQVLQLAFRQPGSATAIGSSWVIVTSDGSGCTSVPG